MEPAQTIIRKLGGPNAVAQITGLHRTRVSSWQRSRAAGGTDGRVPQKHHAALLAFAREKGIELKAEEFLHPPQVAEASVAEATS
jgi:hypothetical protein